MRRLCLILALVAAIGLTLDAAPDAQQPRLRLRVGGTSSGGGGGESEACAFQDDCFHDATNTGVPAGTTLTAYSGPNPVTADDTIIDGKKITDCPLEIQATGVVIQNSQFDCNNADALYVDDAGMYAETSNGTEYAVTIQDSEISCGNATNSSTGISEAYVWAERNEIFHCENALSINQKMFVAHNYIHNLSSSGGGAHEDGAQMSCGHWEGGGGSSCAAGYDPGTRNVTFLHNTIYGMSADDTVFGTSAIITNHDGVFDVNLVIDQNLLAGGATTLYCNRPDAGTMTVTNNHFSTIFGPNVGAFEPSEDCADEGTVSGNVIHETGDPLTLALLWPTPFQRTPPVRWAAVLPGVSSLLKGRR